MIAKLEGTQSTAKQNKNITLNPHKQWEQQQEMNKKQQNDHLRTEAVKSTGGLKFLLAKSSP